ncbi:MAG: SRPBCC family protein [Bythopirellula sp.]|nr:SRPBCC family protein [Bythopirellula sp.]
MAEQNADDREVVSTRLIDAPRQVVFQTFSDPEQLAQWWGPSGFTNTIKKFDFRPGGDWHLTMHGPGGTDYRNESVFVEIVEPERIVFDHLRTMHRFLMTMTFFEFDGKTRVTWRQRFESVAELEKVRAFVPAANEQNFDRLASHLAQMQESREN